MLEETFKAKFKAKFGIQTLVFITLCGLAVGPAAFFLPQTSSVFTFNKLALLTILSLVGAFWWVLRDWRRSEGLRFTHSPLVLPTLLFAVATILATLTSSNWLVSVVGAYGKFHPSLISGILPFLLLVLFSSLVHNRRQLGRLVGGLVGVVALSSLSLILPRLGATPVPNPTGSLLNLAILSGGLLPLAVDHLVGSREEGGRVLWGGSTVLLAAGLILSGQVVGWFTLLAAGVVLTPWLRGSAAVHDRRAVWIVLGLLAVSGLTHLPVIRTHLPITLPETAILLSPRISWAVASSVIQVAPLFGSGPGTFVYNFVRLRPQFMNMGVVFQSPFNEVFSVLTSSGVIGAAALTFWLLKSVHLVFLAIKRQNAPYLTAAAVGLTTSLLVAPASLLVWATVFTVFGLLVAALRLSDLPATPEVDLSFRAVRQRLGLGETSRELLPLGLLAVIGVFLIVTGWGSYRAYAAELYARQGTQAALENDGIRAYNAYREAVRYNPFFDVYHTQYAITNLAVASALASQESEEDESATIQRQQGIQQLIQQAIWEGRLATQINPISSYNWTVLGWLYSNLSGFAEGADGWAIQNFSQALGLDPANSQLWIDLGGAYFRLEDYENAATAFAQSIAIQPAFANGHYNLAQAYKQLGRWEDAARQLVVVLDLLPGDHPDREAVEEELATVRTAASDAAEQAEATPSAELSEGSELTSPAEALEATSSAESR